MVLLLTSALAIAGYGDPTDGVPSPAERELHAWTNTVRMDPQAFEHVYPCDWDSFDDFEQTPQTPLLWHDGLGAAARLHSDDMAATGNFSHNSSDGTPFEVRVADYYESSTVGENIAFGYADPYEAVFMGWMCSDGHRFNIMLPSWEELGTGVNGVYYTQDFGQRGASVLGRPLSMGAHSPARPSNSVQFLVNFYHTSAPDSVEVVVNGAAHAMARTWGVDSMGTYAVSMEPPTGCTSYSFEARLADGSTTRFPESGQYGFGTCEFDDAEAGWFSDAPPGEPPGFPGLSDTGADHWGVDAGDEEVERREWRRFGCDHTGGGLGWAALLVLAMPRRKR